MSSTAATERPSGGTDGDSARRPGRGWRGGDEWVSYVLVGPAMAMMVLFVALPALLAAGLTLFEYDAFERTLRFVGPANFERMLPSRELWGAARNTLVYAAITVPVGVGAGLGVALLIHGLTRGAGFWRSLYFLPVAAMLTAMSVVWRFLFYPDTGLIDATVGGWFGLRDWLNSTTLALPAVAVVGSWASIGTAVILFLAGLSSVPRHLHEVAMLDGAGAWYRFWGVTWPALGPATVFAVVLSVRDALRVFDQVRVMTDGGPLASSQTLSVLLWQRGIKFLDIGGSSVVNLVLLAMLLVATVFQLRTFGRRWEAAGAR